MAADAGLPWERPLGARPLGDGSTEFRVWAPNASAGVSVALGRGRTVAMECAGLGVYETVTAAAAGDDYRFVVDGRRLPDPCSRWQPKGLRGPSRVVAVPSIRRLDSRPDPHEIVIYELHIGTFSDDGTFASAIPYLDELAALGVTAIEVMPVAEFPGARGWGYDGVYLSAAQSSYGGPAGFAALVDAAHERGLGVILDVVYNHVGASGNKALAVFGPYFTGKYETPWGQAINYDDGDCDAVREWVLQSAVGWVSDFGVDGLRLDAIHAIFDSSPEHIVQAVARRVHEADPGALVIAESGLNDPLVVRDAPARGWGCDAAWSDDFHHALHTVLTGEHDGYYADFGRVGQLAKAYHRPHVYDGVYSAFRRRRFGAPADDVPVDRFVVYAQDHDQVGNRAYGDRLPAEVRPLAAFCTLLAPFVPLLFMGEEYGENAPFQFFSDHIDKKIAEATRVGRRREFASFARFEEEIPDPQEVATFERSKLARQRDEPLADLYRRLVAVRRELPRQVDAAQSDEDGRWLRLMRGEFQVVCNFAPRGGLELDSGPATEVVLATDTRASLSAGVLALPPLSGALVR
jgi:maltooligosyltrehalose trehalohydrolase